LSNATQPVRRFFQDVNYGAIMQRATEEVRLNQRRVLLERQAAELTQEYSEYNADVHAFLHYNFSRQPNTSLYLPQPFADPNTGLWNSEPWPAGSASVQQNLRSTVAPVPQQPASQPGYHNPVVPPIPIQGYSPVQQQQVYPPIPTQVLPQPNGAYPVSRDQSLMYNNGEMGYWNAPGYIPAYTAAQPGPYRF
jgi:hypothetical protein